MKQCNKYYIRKFALLFLLLVFVSYLLYLTICKLVRMLNNEVSKLNVYHLCDIIKSTQRKSCVMEITPDILYIISCMLVLFIVYILFVILSELWKIHKPGNTIGALSVEAPISKLSENIEHQLSFDDNDDVFFVFGRK